jgi:hypothetical protein
MRTIQIRLAFACLLVGASLTGCVVAPRSGPAVVYDDVAVVDTAPPPPREELIGVAPYPGYFWISGVWFWEGGRHAWHPGYWEAPRPGYRWVPHRWERVGNSWHLRSGGWRRG